MKKILKMLVIIICLVLCCTGCGAGGNNKNAESKTKVLPHKEKEIRYDILPKQPKFSEILKINKIQVKEGYSEMAPAFGTVGGRDLPSAIYCFLDVNDKINYLEYELTEEMEWKISIPNWSTEVNKIAPMGLISYQVDQLGRKYCSVSADDENVLIYSISETGTLQNIDIREIDSLLINDNKSLVKFEVINDSTLALLYGENDGINERCNIFLFDPFTEECTKTGTTISSDIIFDEKGNYYNLSSSQQYIQCFTIEDTMPQHVIKCDGISSISAISDLIIESENGYLISNDGIYHGKITDEEWNVMLPISKMYYNKEDKAFKNTPISAFPGWLKVNGDDLDFYVETYNSNESNELVWVHYYEN